MLKGNRRKKNLTTCERKISSYKPAFRKLFLIFRLRFYLVFLTLAFIYKANNKIELYEVDKKVKIYSFDTFFASYLYDFLTQTCTKRRGKKFHSLNFF